MDVPIREVPTEWGTLYATTADGTTVRFSTTSPNEGDPAYHLTLSHLWYSADLELSMGTPLRSGPSELII